MEDLTLLLPFFVSGALFFVGLTGVLIRKNILVILMSLELMLNAVNLNFISFASVYGLEESAVFVFFIMSVAAAEAGVGLALAWRIYKVFKEVSVDSLNQMKG